ncbi:hypothetical protein GJ496_009484 [Pomphorhynchus laevis]|nr:hypothetical protein GJ496_009484 [Pomphorhynchus laevis]
MYIPQPNRHYKYFPKLNLKSVSTNFQKKCPVSIRQDIHISNKSVVSDKKERGSISYEKPTTTVHDYDNVKELNLHRPFTSSNYKNPNNKRTKEEYKLGILTFQNNTCLNIPIQCGGLYPLSGLSIMLPQSMHSISPNQVLII